MLYENFTGEMAMSYIIDGKKKLDVRKYSNFIYVANENNELQLLNIDD